MARILIVDDERDILTVTSMLLALEGYDVDTASNGVMALQIIRERPVDLVVTDWMMPRMDGVALCTQLRGEAATSHIPIVLNSSAGTMPEGLGTLFDAFIPKLNGFDPLLALIRSLLPAQG